MALYLKLLRFTKPYWAKLAIAMACMSVVSATNGVTAYLVKPVMDDIFVKRNAAMLYLIPAVVVLLFLVKGLFYYLQAYFMGFVGQRVVTDIRSLVFSTLQRQPLSYFDKTPTGQSISRIMNDVTLVQNTVSDSVTAVLIDVFSIIGLVGVVFYRDWWLAMISFIVLPVAITPSPPSVDD